MEKIVKLIFLGILIVACFFLLRLNIGFKDLLSVILPVLSFLFGYVLSKEKKIISEKEIVETIKNSFPDGYK